MTAVNIDGAHRVPIKRKDDKWFHDLRIPRELQLDQKDYADLDIDRGHMVRREDPNWDPAVPVGNPDGVVTELAKRANFDTFHYTNSAVQHHDFNAGHAKWLGLEDYILNSAKTHGFRACVFSGPIMRLDDEVDPIGDGVVAPREFWKLVVMEDAKQGKLHATAYVLSQGDLIHDLLEKRHKNEATEGFVTGPYQTYQVSIKDLQDGTDYDFSAYVPFDGLAKATGGQEAIDSGEPLYLPLDSVEEIVL
jgi:endonuclease G